ncbi:MAG: short-chain dehydrogenase [Rickettsiales bacterium]|nr:short-chain dehydrogenase [Rickettsiales bacterium]|tara:strand:+ start:4464 stop:5186 length:723 start_codon:yes stop_codon:yes gene_type:complete
MFENIVVFGSTGTIGKSLVEKITTKYPNALIHACSSKQQSFENSNVREHQVNYIDEQSLAFTKEQVASISKTLDLIFVATGMLHNKDIMPEKATKDLSAENFLALYQANTIVPALIAKHFLPLLNRENRAVFAALSARVGSISDNQLGGWYAYRCAKAALNMLIKNLSIETSRRCPKSVVIGLHPGTVKTPLSAPFQKHASSNRLFEPEFSAEALMNIIETVQPKDTGKCIAWDGKEIMP